VKYLSRVFSVVVLLMAANVYAKVVINKPAPEFSVKSADGKTVKLSDYAGKTVAKKLSLSREAAPSMVLLDEDGTVGKLYGAKTTPHMYIIDTKGVLRYMGAIDSVSSANPKDIATSTNYVDKAMGEMQKGKPVSEPVTKAYGCSVKY